MTAIPREQAEVYIRDVLTEFINMAQGVKDSGITVNANGKRILDGLETAKKALVKLEENYFAQLSDGGIQTFLDKCKILARQFELEQSKKIQFLNVQKRTGLRRKKNYLVISCFSGGGNENVGTTFIDAANTGNSDIRNSKGFDPQNDTVTVVNIDSIHELKKILDKGNIDQLDIFSHGGERHLVIGSGNGPSKRELLYENDLKMFNKNAFNKEATINLFGCKTASEKSLNISQKILRKKTIAEAFAIYFRGTTVTGFTGGGIAVPSPSAEIDPAFIHQKGDPVWYKSWGGIRSYKYD